MRSRAFIVNINIGNRALSMVYHGYHGTITGYEFLPFQFHAACMNIDCADAIYYKSRKT